MSGYFDVKRIRTIYSVKRWRKNQSVENDGVAFVKGANERKMSHLKK